MEVDVFIWIEALMLTGVIGGLLIILGAGRRR